MTDDLEERFRGACASYLNACDQLERDLEAAGLAQMVVMESREAADRARDRLLQVVRERDAAAALTDSEGRIHPSPRAQDARNAWLRGGKVIATRPEDTDYWAAHDGVCPECGVPWRIISPGCPHQIVNWHPTRAEDSAQMP